MDDLRSLPIPEELEPVIKNLSIIVGTSKTARKALASRPQRVTVASTTNRTSVADDDDEDEESFAKFPLGRTYPFTFKMMVHKLYRVDEWAKKVKEILEKSKMEFKSLDEQDAVVEEDKAEGDQDTLANKDKNTVHFKVGVSGGGGRRGSLSVVGGHGRQRSQSVVVLGPKTVGPASPLLKSPGSGGQSEFRALKKRCVGRRKSVNGPLMDRSSVSTGRIGGSWVYDAAISSAEHPASTTFPAFPSSPPPSPTSQSGFSSYQALGTQVGVLRKKVSIGGKIMRRVNGGMPRTSKPLVPLPFQEVTNINPTDRISARKRALTIDGMRGVEEMQKKQMKRPFAA